MNHIPTTVDRHVGIMNLRWLVLILMLVIGTAWSGEPIIPPGKIDNQQTKAEQRGTENSPVFVKADVTTKQDREESDRNTKEQKIKAELDALLVKYTFWLAALTGLLFSTAAIQASLFVWQLRLMKVAVEDGTRASNAAKTTAELAEKQIALVGLQVDESIKQTEINRQQFFATHRPKIILRDATCEQDMGNFIVVNYILSNIGPTDAKIICGALDVKVFEGWEFGPDNLPAIDETRSDIVSIPIKAGEQIPLTFTSQTTRWSPANKTCHTFNEPEYGLFFSGLIVYEDNVGTRRHTGFRRKYFTEQHRFLSIGDSPHYEYQD